MNYYNRYFCGYIAADEQTRAASKAHWIACHKQNMAKENNEPMQIFSAQILAQIALAEDFISKHNIEIIKTNGYTNILIDM